MGQIWFHTDITERKREEDALRFLADATNLLSSSLDYDMTLQRVTELAVARIADWCTVSMVPSEEEAARGVRAQQDLRLLEDAEPGSVMVVPIKVRERVFGAINFIRRPADRALRRGRPQAARGARAARRDRHRQLARARRAARHGADAAGEPAAAAPAGDRRARAGGALPARRRPACRWAATSTTSSRRRRTTGPSRRRRVRQGRRGRSADRADPLHGARGCDVRGGSAGRRPARAERGAAAPARRLPLHARWRSASLDLADGARR